MEKKKQQWEIDFGKLKFLKKIGTGNFGEVWKGTWVGSDVAIKTVLETVAANDEFVKRFVDEILLMSTLHHREWRAIFVNAFVPLCQGLPTNLLLFTTTANITMFLGASVTPPNMCLVLEFCVHGNMHEFLNSEKGEWFSNCKV